MPSLLENRLKTLVDTPKRLPGSPLVPPSLLAKYLLHPYRKGMPKKVKATHTDVSAHYGPADVGRHQTPGEEYPGTRLTRKPYNPDEPTPGYEGNEPEVEDVEHYLPETPTAERISAGQELLGRGAGEGGSTSAGFQDIQADPTRPKKPKEDTRRLRQEQARYEQQFGVEKPFTGKGTREETTSGKRGSRATLESRQVANKLDDQYRALNRERWREWLQTDEGQQVGQQYEKQRRTNPKKHTLLQGVAPPPEYRAWRRENYPEEVDETGKIISAADWRKEHAPEAVTKAEAARGAGTTTTNEEQEFRASLSKGDRKILDEVVKTQRKPKMRRWRAGEIPREKREEFRNDLINLVHITTGKTREEAEKFVDKQWAAGQTLAPGGPLEEGASEAPGKPTPKEQEQGNVPSEPNRYQPYLPGQGASYSSFLPEENWQEVSKPPLVEHRGGNEGWVAHVAKTHYRQRYDKEGNRIRPDLEETVREPVFVPFEGDEPETDYSRSVEGRLKGVLNNVGMENYVEVAPPKYTYSEDVEGIQKNFTKTISIKPSKAFRQGGMEAPSPEEIRSILYGFGGPNFPLEELPDVFSVKIGQEAAKHTVQAVTTPKLTIKIPLNKEDFYDRMERELTFFNQNRARDWEDTERYAYYLMRTKPGTTPEAARKKIEDRQKIYIESGAAQELKKRKAREGEKLGNAPKGQAARVREERAKEQHEYEQNKKRKQKEDLVKERKKIEEQADADKREVIKRQKEAYDSQLQDKQEKLRRSRLQGGTGPT
jgi:hypothetical protein